jgi:hypothetical protein
MTEPVAVSRGMAVVLAHAWLQTVVRSNFMPEGRARARAVLEDLVGRLASALTAEPFDAAPAYAVGCDLVAANISSPRQLGDSIALLGAQLLTLAEEPPDQAPARLSALLGQLATGFIETLRARAIAGAECTREARNATRG